MRNFFTLILVSLLITANTIAQTWIPVGDKGFTEGKAQYSEIAIDHMGTPYVVFQDQANNLKATVMKYNGTAWEIVGAPGFSYGEISYADIAIDASGTPYVVFSDDGYSNKSFVWKFNGTDWEIVGGEAAWKASSTQYNSLVLDNDGIPYIALRAAYNGGNITIIKLNDDGSWKLLGNFGACQDISLALDNSGIPYIVYQDVDWNKATVKKYNGYTWDSVGEEAFTSSMASNLSITFDSENVPFISFSLYGSSPALMSYNGSGWSYVGGNIITTEETGYATSFVFDSSDVPFVTYVVKSNDKIATVATFNGDSWEKVGDPQISDGESGYTRIAIDNDDIKYISFVDVANGEKLTVMKLVILPPEITTQPSNKFDVYSGVNVEFSVEATNPDSWQWQVSTDEGITFTDISDDAIYSDCNTSILSFTSNTDLTNYQFRCVLSNEGGTVTSDAATLTVKSPTGINSIEKEGVSIYPVPAKDILYIKSHEDLIVNAQIYDVHGKLLINKIDETNNIKLNLTNLHVGAYIVKIKTEKNTLTRKIIIE